MPFNHYISSAAASLLFLCTVSAHAQRFSAPPHGCWATLHASLPDSDAILGLRHARATRIAAAAPRIDGTLDEAAWCAAIPFTSFVQSRPRPGAVATLPTIARVLYDDAALYVAIRAVDPRPDSILAPFPRRDDESVSDWLFVELDSRHDRRSGYSFGLNPRGVQVDGLWSGDVDFDTAWDGVWQGAASIDSAGWTAEFRIPFSQLALGQSSVGDSLTFGLNVYRTTPHRGQTSNWSPRLPSLLGIVSHFNSLDGLVVPPHHVPLEVVPYVAITGVPGAATNGATAKAGADIRFRPSPNSAVAITVLPDFGQVEADPSQVNLTAFENFLAEQRPFFVEGAGMFNFGSALAYSSRGTSFDEERPFYSRRIGAAPHGEAPAGSVAIDPPATAELLGAARASGRTAGGWSGGVFHGETEATFATITAGTGISRALVEPLTRFSAVRGVRELGDGRADIGVMATLVDRAGMTPALDSLLVRDALVAGIDGRLRFGHGGYELNGFVLASRLGGSPSSIRAVRSAPRHGYDRPDASGALPFAGDTTHDALAGASAQLALARVQGRWQWGITTRAITPGFETNDVGFQRNADWALVTVNAKYETFLPGHLVRHWTLGTQQFGAGWTFGGERRSAVANASGGLDLRNYWGARFTINHEFSADDPEVLRGGPALLMPASNNWGVSVYSDTRKRQQAQLDLSGLVEPATHSTARHVGLTTTTFLADRLQLGLSPSWGEAHAGWQYVAQPVDATGRAHYLLGALHQQTAELTARATLAFSSHLTVQVYAQAFASGGTYDGLLEVVDARAPAIADRLRTIAASRLQRGAPGAPITLDAGAPSQLTLPDPAFSDRAFHLNALLRYEFAPGSTLFLVWTQQRLDSDLAPFGVSQDLRRLRDAPGTNALLVKISYWLAH